MFIKASDEYTTLTHHIPAPYFRKVFIAKSETDAVLRIGTGGFYRVFLNGREYTKGFLAPYIANPNHFVYYDEYCVPLQKGENVIGVLLGNGLQNNPGGYVWDFDTAPFRAAPSFFLQLRYTDTDNEQILESDTTFKTAPSPIVFDDYRLGEHYDATREIADWHRADFDDTEWANALEAVAPKGELARSKVEPIRCTEEVAPIAVTKLTDGYLYDFGVINTGVVRLCVRGKQGQRITMQHAECLIDGDLNMRPLWSGNDEEFERDRHLIHTDVYICKGGDTERYTPSFVYHGFRYVKVCGITEQQATDELLTFVVFHSDLATRGDFTCSDPILNKLQEITRRSGISNFQHFPNDCPQREKNGWTADAALAAEYMLLNFAPEVSYRQWQAGICKAQREDGALPGIVPTGGWGFHWGNGPAWDCVLVHLPYYVYVYRGETAMITESAEAIARYLTYLASRRNEKGLCEFGLGDWCHVGDIPPKAPLCVTDTIVSIDIADKSAFLFDVIGLGAERDRARTLAAELRAAFRAALIDFDTMTVFGDCQTSQAMALYYGLFDKTEQPAALQKLLALIHSADDFMDVGVLGGRVIFHLLCENGYGNLAYKMIARPEFPSYGYLLKEGATTLWERFMQGRVDSLNHAFWGDISALFIKRFAGLQFNPSGKDISTVTIKPTFIKALTAAEAHYDSPLGRITSAWKRRAGGVTLEITVPQGMTATVILTDGLHFEGGKAQTQISDGHFEYTIGF